MTHTETPADQLRAAKARIATPDKWTQGDYSAEVHGIQCFCALGALGEEDEEFLECPDAVMFLREALPAEWLAKSKYGTMENGSPIAEFNDSHTHADVMSLFDRAIELAEASA